ncbi:laccase domain-containing protein [Desulfurispira natronophila]|uniref:Purine nucleoside phosphorylase n=1 Tax=Desulfurispira natronophila TaxID=682562 RepID=A0A7W7Y4W5_9BACT|nr:hypothetical protein [Desulfurispira natronophila]
MFHTCTESPIEYLYSDNAAPWLCHGFTSARKGHSQGAFARGNLSFGVGDDPAAVQRNWDELNAFLGTQSISIPRQVHGVTCIHLTEPRPGLSVEADALWTDRDQLAIGVMTADCVPVVLQLADHQGKGLAVAAIHAGWRSALDNISFYCLQQIRSAYPSLDFSHSQAFIGPSICQHCYEVSHDLADQFCQAGYDQAVSRRKGHSFLDLWRVTVLQLMKLGFARNNIDLAARCTRCDEGFFSHRKNPQTGRELAFVWMERRGATLSFMKR